MSLVRWPENGLGRDFLSELQAALGRISETPEIYAAGYRDVRSVRLRRFPYVIHFRLESETIVVLAILFGGRDPSIWQRRV